MCTNSGTEISAVVSSLLLKVRDADGREWFLCACRMVFLPLGVLCGFAGNHYQSALSQSHPGCFTLRCLLNLQRCIKVTHQMHHTLAAPKHIIDSTHILLPIRPVCIKPTNYNPVAMGTMRLIGLISVRNCPYANFGHIPSRSVL